MIFAPFPADIHYPTLLDFPAPKLKAYPPQTVIAEKIHTMVEKGNSNSRIKDYYDVWLLFSQIDISLTGLPLALLRTFTTRGMDFDLNLAISVIEQYAKQPGSQLLWEQFIRKELPGINRHKSFQDLSQELSTFLVREIAKSE